MNVIKNINITPFLWLPVMTVAFVSLPTFAQTEVEFGVSVLSDYIDNGESLSGNNAVVQGGFEITHGSGWFGGLQISTLGGAFVDANGDIISDGQEVVPFVGFGFDIGEVGIELAYEYFSYPEIRGADEGELILGVSFADVWAEVGYIVNADDKDAEGSVVYMLGWEYEFMPDTAFEVVLGYDDPNAESGVTFWQTSLLREAGPGVISLTYAQRDERDAQSLFAAGYHISF